MRNGTQEELDAAREDARLIPYDAVFKVKNNNNGVRFSIGESIVRRDLPCDFSPSKGCIPMWDLDGFKLWYVIADNLEPIK